MIKMVSAEAWLDISIHETQDLNLTSYLLKITVDLQRCQLENSFLARCFNHGKLYTIVELIKCRIRKHFIFWHFCFGGHAQAFKCKNEYITQEMMGKQSVQGNLVISTKLKM